MIVEPFNAHRFMDALRVVPANRLRSEVTRLRKAEQLRHDSVMAALQAAGAVVRCDGWPPPSCFELRLWGYRDGKTHVWTNDGVRWNEIRRDCDQDFTLVLHDEMH